MHLTTLFRQKRAANVRRVFAAALQSRVCKTRGRSNSFLLAFCRSDMISLGAQKKCPTVGSFGVAQSPKSSAGGTLKLYCLHRARQGKND